MMLFCPPPPSRVVVPVTPGVNCVGWRSCGREIGRFSTEDVVMANDRSPLDAWMRGASDGDVDGLGCAARLEREGRDSYPVAAADGDAGLADGAESVHGDFDRIGAGVTFGTT